MKIKERLSQLSKWVGIIWIVGFIFFRVYDLTVNSPRAEAIQTQLEDEFKLIKPLPNATVLDYDSSHKTSQVLVESTYKTKLDYSEIRAYYDDELAKHGWVFFEEESMKGGGIDYGGKSVYYCKGEYTTSLHYAGESANYGWDFALSVNWGLGSHDMDKRHAKGCQ